MLNDAIPETTSSEVVYNEYFKIQKDKLHLSTNETYYYYTLITKPIAIMILASTKGGLFLINREYRHPTNHFLLSCPGGIKHEDETIIEGAKRELMEETGYSAKSWHIMGSAFPFPGITGQRTCYVRAKDAHLVKKPTLETAEIIETQLLSEKTIRELIISGVQVDGLLCTALFFNNSIND